MFGLDTFPFHDLTLSLAGCGTNSFALAFGLKELRLSVRETREIIETLIRVMHTDVNMHY